MAGAVIVFAVTVALGVFVTLVLLGAAVGCFMVVALVAWRVAGVVLSAANTVRLRL